MFSSVEVVTSGTAALSPGLQQRFEALVQHSSDVITIIDVDGTVRYQSESVHRIFGYRADELVGRSLTEVFETDDAVAYLNTAYLAPRLRAVTEAGLAAVERTARPWTVTPPDFFDTLERVRGKVARLVGRDDLQGDCHSHSDWSDGHVTIERMAAEAHRRGLRYQVLTDHSVSLAIANGLSPERVEQQRRIIGELNERFAHEGADFRLLHGCEMEIRPDGRLDYDDALLARFDVVVASDGKAGLAALQGETFDCVITDLRMPGIDGLAVLKWVADHQPGVDVVMLTGHGDVKDAVEAMRQGAWDFLVKDTPFDGAVVKAALANNAAVRTETIRGARKTIVSFATPAARYEGVLNDQHLVERIEGWFGHTVLGDTTIEAIFSDYRDFAGIRFPTRIVQRQGGYPLLDVMVTDVIRVRADADRETVARLLTDHNFLAMPVVDDKGHPVGLLALRRRVHHRQRDRAERDRGQERKQHEQPHTREDHVHDAFHRRWASSTSRAAAITASTSASLMAA